MDTPKKFLNVEIKAKCKPDKVIEYLKSKNARFVGDRKQVDTYFNVKAGRLKIREDSVQDLVIYYERDENTKVKDCNVIMFEHKPETRLKEIFEKAHGIKGTVKKQRQTFWIDNVKFDIDRVEGLGDFVEIKANDYGGKLDRDKLQKQLNEYKQVFGIEDKDIVDASYSDLILSIS